MKPHGGKKACEQALMRQYMDEDEEPEDSVAQGGGDITACIFFGAAIYSTPS
jgi:hypothetical protein